MRSPIVLLAVPLALVVLGYWLSLDESRNPPPLRDYLAFCSSGQLFLEGKNPYSPAEVFARQKAITGNPDLPQPLMLWNPPFIMPLLALCGLTSPWLGQKLWILLQVGSLVAGLVLLLRVYPLPPKAVRVAIVAAIVFSPAFVLILYAQSTGLLLLGLAGFLYCHMRERPYTAGAFAALTALKPHVLFAFGLLLVLDGLTNRKARKVLVGGAAVLVGNFAIAWLMNPMILGFYLDTMTKPSDGTFESVQDVVPPVLGYWLRQCVPGQPFWVQCLPTVAVSIATIIWWLRHRQPIDWRTTLPPVLFASCIAAAYGAWIFDLVVLLVPVLYALHRNPAISRRPMAAYLALNIATSALPMLLSYAFNIGTGLPAFVYFAPALLQLYAWALRSPKGTP
jgi:hypothetical protein